jgi:hypothetical protein
MKTDPIIAEVRKAREELFAECGHDVKKLFAHLRKCEAARKQKTAKSVSKRRVVA